MFKSWDKNILRRLRSNIKIAETRSQRMKLGRAVAEEMIKLLVFRRKAVGNRIWAEWWNWIEGEGTRGSEKNESCSVVLDSLWPHGLPSPWNSPGQTFPSPGDLPYRGIEPRSLILQADSSPAELPGKPKKTGVGSLSLMQQIFLIQESNQGLLHCRRILHQLNYHLAAIPSSINEMRIS